jgi:hypothetical protein
MKWRWSVLCLIVFVGGCQSTREQLLAEGYPPAFADGFQDGCGSGRQAAGVISGEFKKNVPRYLKDPQYAEGWDDGFRQCKAMVESRDRNDYRDHYWNERDQRWQREKDRDNARAYRSQ